MTGITVVGNHDFGLGFQLAGIHNTFVEENIEQRVALILAEKETDILVLHDEDYKKLSSQLRKRASESVKPIVIAVGSLEEDELRVRIKKVIGVDLYKK
ncbi:MAG TPA: V-type ATP synthase subunit F [Thermoplasmata archaeon]|jgi:vacuolar-type H+-ATPase subunit F/Vma7|nr:V-type ATP synthase subunit F [Thermoplasmata archaeon]HIH29685.1 V-type ATP synthase subunit F [Thermoplasmata archaeon]